MNDQSNENDDLMFAPEDANEKVNASSNEKWRVLIVDDEKEVHSATTLTLSDYKFENKNIEFFHAYTAQEAKDILAKEDDMALLLLDVVMESEHAGLDLTKYIRDEINNNKVRIILRTGQPGQAPQEEVIIKYDINDYKEKSEITSTQLFTAVTTALRSYQELELRFTAEASLEFLNKNLEQMVQDRTNQLLNTSKKLAQEEKVAAIGTLAQGVAHEFNNINVSAIGYSQLLVHGLSLEGKEKGYLNKMCESLERSRNISDSLLLLSSEYTENFEKFSLQEIAQRVLKNMEETFKENKVNVKIEEVDKDIECHLNQKQMENVIQSLYINAIHGLIKNDKKVVLVKIGKKDKVAYLSVSDNGCGIHQEDLKQVYVPFFSRKGEKSHGDAPMAAVKGVGLGLSVSQAILKNHEGTIRIDSVEGKGTKATIFIPLLT